MYTLIHIGALLYAATTTVVALTGALSADPERRRAAREILRLLLRRSRR
ncbi:hypothetical protein [Paractinoplanes rishiriensis]|uniref:Uncharacterized protein n=1 Tax=Paractinoplanes rishiriensis TaxID=1050105 RepID=A0A919K7U0_9ACTN|nr:hypothetical protein [Actinoplanes rishiriensis]GIF00099.1 hypothetical protein Ari01nite_75630 [Actinoplanes rishiriensis]